MQTPEAITEAVQLDEYKEHIAWKAIVAPWIARERKRFQQSLVEVVLSQKPILLEGGQLLTAERCAAYIEALDALERLFVVINRRRDSALAKLGEVDIFNVKELDRE